MPRVPAPCEEADGAADRRRGAARRLEQRALEVGERRRGVLRRARRQLLDAPVRERREIVGRPRSDANATRPGS